MTAQSPHRVVVVAKGGFASTLQSVLKRGFDVVVATVALVVSGPLVLAAIVAIRIDSPGPAIFRQIRFGRSGRMFRLVKLRTMYVDAFERFPELCEYATTGDPDYFYFHHPRDPRVTTVGRVLRRWSIDELPNFWNVLRGEMSVVGPRPEIPELADLYGQHLEQLLSIRPGVTSPASAGGRDRLSFSEKLASDLHYVDHHTLSGDVIVVLRTAWSAATGSGIAKQR